MIAPLFTELKLGWVRNWRVIELLLTVRADIWSSQETSLSTCTSGHCHLPKCMHTLSEINHWMNVDNSHQTGSSGKPTLKWLSTYQVNLKNPHSNSFFTLTLGGRKSIQCKFSSGICLIGDIHIHSMIYFWGCIIWPSSFPIVVLLWKKPFKLFFSYVFFSQHTRSLLRFRGLRVVRNALH